MTMGNTLPIARPPPVCSLMFGCTTNDPSMGRVFPIFSSTKQKVNTQSPTKIEVVSVDDCMPSVLWTRYWLDAQEDDVFENIVYQDNKSDIILGKNHKASIIH